MKLSEKLFYHRKNRGLTFAELEAISGVDQGVIKKIELQEQENSKHALALAKGLDLDLTYLLDSTAPLNLDSPPKWRDFQKASSLDSLEDRIEKLKSLNLSDDEFESLLKTARVMIEIERREQAKEPDQ